MSEMTAVAARPQEEEAPPGPVEEPAHRHWFAAYGGGEEMPLGGYSLLMGLYNAMVAGLLIAAQRRGRLPERIATSDLLLLGIATHKLSRLISMDWVTSPLRAPFAKYEGTAGAGEVREKPRGHGVQRALGDLFT